MKRDISGLSKRTTLAVITDDIDRSIDLSLQLTEAFMIDHGADEIQLEAEITRQRAELVLWREQSLARVAAELGIVPEGSTVH